MTPASSQTVSYGPTPTDNTLSPLESGFKIFSSYLGGAAKKKEQDATEKVDFLKLALSTGQGYVDSAGKVQALPYQQSKGYYDTQKTQSDITESAAKIPYYNKMGNYYDAYAKEKDAQTAASVATPGTLGKQDMRSTALGLMAELQQRGKKASDPGVQDLVNKAIDSAGHGPEAEVYKKLVLSMLQ